MKKIEKDEGGGKVEGVILGAVLRNPTEQTILEIVAQGVVEVLGENYLTFYYGIRREQKEFVCNMTEELKVNIKKLRGYCEFIQCPVCAFVIRINNIWQDASVVRIDITTAIHPDTGCPNAGHIKFEMDMYVECELVEEKE